MKLGRSHCGDVHIVKESPVLSFLFLKELQPLDLPFSLKNTLSMQLLLNPLGDFDETWNKERSHCVDVHIVKGALSNYFSRSYGSWTWVFFLKNTFVSHNSS
jgi:hypothetical protein